MVAELQIPSLHIPAAVPALPQGWQWVRLDAACSGIFDCPHSTPKLTTDGPLLARSQDIRSGVLRIDAAACVSEETYQERVTRAEPRHGDLLYSREGTYFGIAAEVPPNMRVCLGQRMVLLRPAAERVNFRYLRYWLNSPILGVHVSGFRDGSVAERLNLPTIRGLPVLLPPKSEQDRIAAILGALDDKIELNRRMNATLEAMAQALFKSWFVDFDPVRAKTEGRQPFGMDAETAALFPESFENSPLGDVPSGWTVLVLGEIAGINESTIKKPYRFESIEYVDISSVTRGRLDTTTTYSLPDAPSRAQRLVRHGDTIWSMVRPNRESYLFVHRPHENLIVSTGFAVLTPRKVPPSYLYSWVTTREFVDYLTANADGSAYPAVRSDHFATAPVLSPDHPVLDKFESLVGPMRDRIASNARESSTLAAIRDALLPKLLSGDIRVKDAERMAEVTA